MLPVRFFYPHVFVCLRIFAHVGECAYVYVCARGGLKLMLAPTPIALPPYLLRKDLSVT